MSVADQKFRWLVREMGFEWDDRRGEFVNPDYPTERVTPTELRAHISYRCFQRVVLRKVTRARKRLHSTAL